MEKRAGLPLSERVLLLLLLPPCLVCRPRLLRGLASAFAFDFAVVLALGFAFALALAVCCYK